MPRNRINVQNNFYQYNASMSSRLLHSASHTHTHTQSLFLYFFVFNCTYIYTHTYTHTHIYIHTYVYTHTLHTIITQHMHPTLPHLSEAIAFLHRAMCPIAGCSQVRCHAESIKRHLDQFAVESKSSAAKAKAPQPGDGDGRGVGRR